MSNQPASPSRTVHELVAEALVAHGVRLLFGLIGDANLFMVDSYVRKFAGRYVAARHEGSAVLMALGHAQASDGVGVATITHGPALTNAMTALVEGVRARVPLVLLCGDTPPHDLTHLQKIDQRELVAATGAGFVELRSPETAARDVAVAFRRATLERRPVVLDMRVDLQWQPTDAAPIVLRAPSTRMAAAQGADLDDALGIIAGARRPLLLAGRGASAADARAALVRLAARIEAPLTTTLKASGLFEGEPWNLGVFGGLSHPATAEIIMQSDCVVSFGASLSRHTTESGALLRGKRIVQVLQHPEGIGAAVEPDVALLGDVASTAAMMCDMLDEAEIAPSGFAVGPAPERPVVLVPDAVDWQGEPGFVDMDRALLRLNEAVPADRILVTDLGRFVTTAWLAFPVLSPAALVNTAHFGAIGCGLAAAIGAATAAEGKPTLLVTGDGGLALAGLSELLTAVANRLDLIVVICNDDSYGAEHIQFTQRSMDPGLSMLGSPDFAAIARAMGCAGQTVRSIGDLERACRAVEERSGPLVIDLKLDANRVAMR